MRKLGPYELNKIYTGDAKILAKEIPDESVDLIFTDPVYDRIEDYEWLAKTAMRILKQDSALLTFCGIGYLPETLNALIAGGLHYKWQMIGYITNEVKHRHAPPGKCLYTSLLWFEKGNSKRCQFMLDVRAIAAHTSSSNHHWSKPPLIPWYYLNGMSNTYDLVLDPFTGSGTIPAVCKALNRNYVAFEINPETAELARQQVTQTQPPLPIEIPEQIALL
jgi:DNA modification methylase